MLSLGNERPIVRHRSAWRIAVPVCVVLLLWFGVDAQSFSEAMPATTQLTGWHLPLPAGEWQIYRGPCSSLMEPSHACDDYEERCAIDIGPADLTTENVPLLAPQAGRVFFAGHRPGRGLSAVILHDDGSVSNLMQIGRLVVSQDQWVSQGDIIGYTGKSGSDSAHVHFFVQPNLVQRACSAIEGLDHVDYHTAQAISSNLAIEQLTWIDPPRSVLEHLPLPTYRISRRDQYVHLPLVVAPGSYFRVPVLLTEEVSATKRMGVVLGLEILWSSSHGRTSEGALFSVPVRAGYTLGQDTWTPATGEALAEHVLTLVFTVTETLNDWPLGLTRFGEPQLVAPLSYSVFRRAPNLCWQSGVANFDEWRVAVAGPTSVLSEWQYSSSNATCWRPPSLPPGTYFWKVFTRDYAGNVQGFRHYPLAFVIKE